MMKPSLFDQSNKGRFSSLNILQWVLPLALALTAFFFEFAEHHSEEELYLDLPFISEVIIFGLLGPLCISFIIIWMRHLVNAERQAITEVHVLNHALENKIAERTAALEQRNQRRSLVVHEHAPPVARSCATSRQVEAHDERVAREGSSAGQRFRLRRRV